MEYKILLNNTEYDITNSIDFNSMTTQQRIDDAFASGSLAFASIDLKKNIPPYTLLNIYDNGVLTAQWFISSNTSLNPLEGITYHNCDLLELTAILECFVLGSKNFSVTGTNTYDKDKVDIICKLMADKYKIQVKHNLNYSEQIEYTFSAGTTMYSALSEIATRYNERVRVKSIIDNTITIESISYDAAARLNYELNPNKILKVENTQSVNDYGLILETEAVNVIDRTNSVTEILTVRGDNAVCTDEEVKLYTSTRYEKINELWAKISGVYCSDFIAYIDSSMHDLLMGGSLNTIYHTFSEWVAIANWLEPIYTKYGYFIDREIFDNFEFTATYDGTKILFRLNTDTEFEAWLPYECLTQEIWSALDTPTRTLYPYYQSGSNEIYSLNLRYKDDFWNNWFTHLSRGPFLSHPNYNKINVDGDSINKIIYYVRTHYVAQAFEPDLFNTLFKVVYTPMVDVFVDNSKTLQPTNENAIKGYSRSYNNGANFIDYDLLIDSMEQSNNMLGVEEITLIYDSTNGGPNVTNSFVYDGVTWYIASINEDYDLSQRIMTINATRSYCKVADAIGVATQFNATKNALNNIIDRPIHFEYNTAIHFDRNNLNDLYIGIAINGNIENKIYKKATLLNVGNKYQLYCEAQDQYVLARKFVRVLGEGAELLDVPYTDSNAEIQELLLYIVTIKDLTLAQSKELPHYNGTPASSVFVGRKNIYKDQREKLAFTITLKNVNIE